MNELTPIEGAWVCKRSNPDEIGVVVAIRETPNRTTIEADFGPKGKITLDQDEWGCGLQIGHCVQDVPLSGVRETLGAGTVLHVRELATRFQVLVQLHATGRSIWLPFERLRRIMDPELLYRRAGPIAERGAERFSLNIIAHALSKWNEATGALDRLDVDPLPHQISLVHRIVNSGQTNWLIADDVGLGKTIEVGLLLAALERRQNLRRILFVVPSGLTRQWKEEMLAKFDRRFLIFGTDFRISDHKEWGLFERVIVSLDLAKPRQPDDDGTNDSTPFGMMLAAGVWDLIVFDEAHRLARDDRGRSTLRYKLAQALRAKTDRLILLTGTPHQGDTGKFRNLLTLVRPDLGAAIDEIETEPDVVQEIVLRNRKIDAVDLDGSFLFKGVIVRRATIDHDPEFETLERQLQDYLRMGYRAGDTLGGAEGRAIGFVMTIYRKMASSSIAALYIALKNRLERLTAQNDAEDLPYPPPDDEELDGDDQLEERSRGPGRTPFFETETQSLRDLMAKAAEAMRNDKKGDALVSLVCDIVIAQKKKVLIFTEYRSTQAYLIYRLKSVVGEKPEIINGGMTVEEKRNAIRAFENENSILISTEAGGEGLNLHKDCHILINYDLPWNPSRISQRIGRLYRYGQKQKVVVINFLARDTIDNEIVSILFDRLDVIVREMATVGSEFDERYAADILGELLDRIDISMLLEEAQGGRVDRTQDRIDDALNQAKQAKLIQDDILSFATSTGSPDLESLGQYTTVDVATFIKRAARFFEIEVEESGDQERFTMRLPAHMKGRFAEFGGRTVVSATTRRAAWRPGDQILIDFSTEFLKWLVDNVTAEQFNGSYSVIARRETAEFVAAFLARFQNDQGHTLSEKLIVLTQDPGALPVVNTSIVGKLLSSPSEDAAPRLRDPVERKRQMDLARDHAELLMAQELTRFKHPNDLVTLAAGEFSSS
ncbi:DEAD/DEAH box helicase [Bradyrhizobium sp. SZCCHNRI3043]|uniref:DEAD/DEAH box helicase n=1 Tax=Bradyrhizobium sp. SZCCHNRI3043 TaxID=3057292 RepID=UPI0028EEDB85|nr:DEAD/DEAH box helicase [Bradyrhizobium sp. SZCCHNRI3043]